jgi:uncharacterized membrane-anchored protein YhcB (DUF1043 family)
MPNNMKEAFADGINLINRITKEYQRLYEKTPATDSLVRDEIINGIEQSKKELTKTRAEYEIFKKYKMRTTISK